MNDNTSAFCAAEYEKQIERTIPYYHDFYRDVADTVNAAAFKSVDWLDVGCGTGKMAETAFLLCKNIQRFVMTDRSPKMIDLCKRKFCDRAAEYDVRSVTDLCFFEKFDVATSLFVHHYLTADQRKIALQKCRDALKPGGLFFSFENFAPSGEATLKLFMRRWYQFQRENERSDEECRAHLNRYGKNYFPIGIDDHRKLLTETGYREIELIRVSGLQCGFVCIK